MDAPYQIAVSSQQTTDSTFEDISRVRNFSFVIPGKLAGSAQLGGYRLGPEGDPIRRAQLAFLKSQGVGAIVSLSLADFPPAMLQEYGIQLLQLYIPDGGAPEDSQVEQFQAFVDTVHSQTGKATVVHCLAGRGRTGTMLAAYLILREAGKQPNTSVQEHIQRLRALRPHSVESFSQVLFLEHLHRKTLKARRQTH